jgi:subfamily B ATP-binding cassette protein MsbA
MDNLVSVRELVTAQIPYIWRTVGLSWRGPITIAGLSLLVVISDLLSIGLIVPFLQAFMGGGIGSRMLDTPLGFLVPLFEGLDQGIGIRLLVGGIILITLLRVSLTFVSTLMNFRYQVGVERRVRAELFGRALGMNIESLGQSRLSDIFFVINNQPNSASYCIFTLISFIPSIFSLILFASVVVMVSWQLTLVSMLLFGLSYLLLKKTNHLVRANSRDHNLQAAALYHIVMESLNGLQVVRAFVREEWAQKRYAEQLESYIGVSSKGVALKARLQPIQSLASTFSLALILLIGTFVLTVDGRVWSEMIVLYLLVMARLSGPINTLLRLRTDIASQSHGVGQVVSFLKNHAPPAHSHARAFEGLRDEIKFEGLRFRYAGNDMDVLDYVSFSLPRGRTTALVGSSGSGKSTIIKLLARFYDPLAGRITCDGRDIGQFDVRSWRRSIGIVSQNTFLFNETIRENIRFGRLEATDEEVEDAARHAHAHDFILETEHGYETLVGDRGVRLSGGQAQRIAIARAILANPPILILDEATSSLDAVSERHVQDALSFLSRDRTVLVIAHRLSTIRHADNIVVLEKGRVVEQGAYDDLFARKGAFWNYAQHQHMSSDDSSAAVRPGHSA